MVFDVGDGHGMIAFTYTSPGFRSAVQLAAWGPRAFGQKTHRLYRAAAMAAFIAQRLAVVEAFIQVDNTLARRAARRCGMHERAILRDYGWYNGIAHDMVWYEGTRADVGLEPVEGTS